MDACATSRAVSGSDEVHLALAEQLFDSIRHPSDVDGALPGAPADGGDRGARISTSDLARVIRACADTMEGETGVCIAVDDLGVPLAPCGAVPDDSQPDQRSVGPSSWRPCARCRASSAAARSAWACGRSCASCPRPPRLPASGSSSRPRLRSRGPPARRPRAEA
ncbi:unnamed protein product, partial [Prorocentrum cordatum]